MLNRLNKAKLVDVISKSLEKINPEKLITSSCSYKDGLLKINNESIIIPKNKKITILGSGKAAQSMGKALFEIMDTHINKMILVGPYMQEFFHKKVEYLQSSHPLPTQKSLDAANKLTQELQKLQSDDIFIYLLSGGNSALVEMPAQTISLEDFQIATSLMLKASMPIEAINCVRKHISLVKAGGLCNYTQAKGFVLVLSDVLGDNLEDIGSAPFYYDKTTFKDAYNYLKNYKVFEKLPQSIQNHLEEGINKKIKETRKKESENLKHYIIGSNSVFLKSIQNTLLEYKISPTVFENSINEDVEVVCKKLLDFCDKNEKGCFIFGGEATVLVKGEGKGGRNQHLVLKFLSQFPKNKEIVFMSVASDGIDGNSDAAGAIIDTNTLQKVEEFNMDIQKYMDNFDSNTFFQQIDSLVKSGPTHNNMLDAVVLYIK